MNSTLKRFFASLIILAALAPGCGALKNSAHLAENTKNEYTDSLGIKDEVKDSIIYVPIPLEAGQAIVTIGDTSRLETSVAKSTAFIDKNGHLRHTLENKSDRRLQAIVPVRTKTIYHGVVNNKTQAVKLTNTIYKEKELTSWQKFRLSAFGWLCTIIMALAIWIFRKPILKLIKK